VCRVGAVHEVTVVTPVTATILRLERGKQWILECPIGRLFRGEVGRGYAKSGQVGLGIGRDKSRSQQANKCDDTQPFGQFPVCGDLRKIRPNSLVIYFGSGLWMPSVTMT
jgi:hypothetical protein